ncbi:MAG: hypothetical protein A3F14_04300 [Gammaproteobacteria bacterium RIFCSPHIGHO2_12_FULL_43_28]|nr:MAG: hypothetical protein A3F14_04300 [Gammaproteobacteria bacterium RIFCSPHIGHO2_12_FULL_43_28]
MSDIEIEIDGRKLTAKPNQTVIQVADEAGIYIPRFCYHKHLSIAANCRMCLVEVEKVPKALPACATPITPGMKVLTKSQRSIDAQRAVMEFLLINHPLDCPICDQGGECELQDLSMGHGSSHSDYDECKRSVQDENLGPLIATEMTRCIHCTRCVRFGDEVAGMRELGITYRGQHAEIGTYVEEAVKSEVSGNIIDLCPVGALTSKPYRFTARAWELEQAPSVSPHDCIGSNLFVHTRNGDVMRVVPRENAHINQTWIADRDRYSYTGLYHADRLSEPRAKIGGQWQTVSWEKAFSLVVERLQKVLNVDGPDQLGALASPNSTLEEFYLLQKLMRALGSPHIDHRLREKDMRDQAEMPAYPGMEMPMTALSECDAIVLIGSNLQKEQPIAALQLRRAIANGAAVVAINPVDYQFNFALSAKAIIAPQRLPQTLAAILAQLKGEANRDTCAEAIANLLKAKQKVCVIVGALSMHHEEAALIRQLAQRLVTATSGRLVFMTDGANSAGAWLSGVIPHRLPGALLADEVGLNAYEMLKTPRKAYILLNVEPDLDCANATLAIEALRQASTVIALSMYRNPTLEAHADIILPITPFTETAGTFVNAAGIAQHFHGVTKAYGSSRPAWKVLRVLGNFLQLSGFDYESAEEVTKEVNAVIASMQTFTMQVQEKTAYALPAIKAAMQRIGEIPIYAIDSLVRRAGPLQKAQTIMEGNLLEVRLHSETASQLQLQTGDMVKVSQAASAILLPVVLDNRVAKEAVWMAGATDASAVLGDLFGEIKVEKA